MFTRGFDILVVCIAAAVLGAVGCSNDSKDSQTPTAGIQSTVTPVAATATPAATTPTVVPTPGAPRVQVSGLFSGPPPAGSQPPVTTRILAPRPPSTFPAWDALSAVIYDTKLGTTTNIGIAYVVNFSPDSSRAAWIATTAGGGPGPATLMDIATGARRTFGDGQNIVFLDDRRVVVNQPQTSNWRVFDIATGQLSTDQSLPARTLPGEPSYPPAPVGYYWVVTPDQTTALSRGWTGRSDFKLIERSTGVTALQFDAVLAAPGGDGEVVVATPLQGAETNVFVVNIQSGKAEFIARTRFGQGPNWPLSGSARYVLWTDNYCWAEGGAAQGAITLYDRTTKSLTSVDDGVSANDLQRDRFARLTPAGVIALGSFGAQALIDPVSFAYTTVLPGVNTASSRTWSPDYRYAAYASGGGHGGLC